ncbi:DUF2934 domain-containing protein [Niveispirillum irakense]|uniref:DUF2934 domain-containing protein n=1 Tax=Niveispirillum irakense TaxID=34011 RepID=UPI0004177242|nr:DUF2934 domain-containing protein [Niveispirillum irakense]
MLDNDRIRQRAHEIWEREGRPLGREAQHWEQARNEIAQQKVQDGARAESNATLPPSHEAKPGNLFSDPDNPNRIDKTDITPGLGIERTDDTHLVSTETQGVPKEQR